MFILFSIEGLKKYFLNTTWLIAERILRLLSGILIGVLIINYLGPKLYGDYSYAIAFIGIFASISNFGIDSIYVKYLVENKFDETKLFWNALSIKLTGSLIVFIIISTYCLISNIDNDIKTLIVLLSINGFTIHLFPHRSQKCKNLKSVKSKFLYEKKIE